MVFDAFQEEHGVIARAEALLAEGGEFRECRAAFAELLKSYKRLFKVEKRVLRFSDRNERQLLTVSQALQQAKQAAEAANRSKSLFLANMSHEIRTPMNAVIGLTELALTMSSPPQVREHLVKIGHASRSLLRIINDILDFSRIESGKLHLDPVDFLLQDLCVRLGDLFQVSAAESGVALRFVVPRACQGVWTGDLLRLEQILVNLVGNALKFTRQGTVDVRVAVAERGDPAVLKFSVRDTGMGIAQGDLARLFQPFEQADGSTTRKHGGTGLGLAISKRLTEMMGGSIWAESTEGRGSVFCFTVRLGRPARARRGGTLQRYRAEREQVDPRQVARQIGGARILLVEDNALNRQVAEGILRSVGLVVESVVCGEEAVVQVGRAEYDCVLMDIQMPDMDGYAATRRIRADERFVLLPIIAMTAHAMAGDREKSLAAGMNDHVVKPINTQHLFAVLLKWVVPRGGPRSVLYTLLESSSTPFGYEIAGVDVPAALERLGHNQTLFRAILLDLRRDYAGAAAEMRAGLAGRRKGDWDAAQRLAHSVKGMAGNLSAYALFDAASALEESIRKVRREEWPERLEAFAQALAEVAAGIDRFERAEQGATGGGGSSVVDRAVLVPLVQRLSHLVLTSDAGFQEVFDTLKSHLAGVEGEAALALHRLETQLNRFDFQEASLSLTRLAKALAV